MRSDRLWYQLNSNKSLTSNEPGGQLVSSFLTNGKHSPCLDIDFEAELIPSSTPGHYHLYLDGLELTWEKYKNLLTALAEAGVISSGYKRYSLNYGRTLLRRPGLMKYPGDGLAQSAEKYDTKPLLKKAKEIMINRLKNLEKM